MLFKLSYRTIYHLPYRHNATMYQLNEFGKTLGADMAVYPVVVHMNGTAHKHVERVRDDYLAPLRTKIPALYRAIKAWKRAYYGPRHREVEAAVAIAATAAAAEAAAKSNVG